MLVNEDPTVVVTTGSPVIGGSHASMAIMVAYTLGFDYDRARSSPTRRRSATPMSPAGSRVSVAVMFNRAVGSAQREGT